MSSLFSRLKSATTSPKQTDWSCPQCTFHNRAKNPKCEMCETVRPTQSSIFQLKIQVASGKPIELHVEKRTTIGSLKNLLEPKVGIPAARQKLFLVPRSELSDDSTKMEHAIPSKKHRDQITIVVEEKATKKKPEKKDKSKDKEEKKQKEKEKEKEKEEIEEVGSRAEDSDVPTSQDTSGDGHSEIVAPSIVPDDDDGEDWTADPPAEGEEATEWDDTKFLQQNQVAEQSLEEKAKVQKTKETSYAILTEEEVLKEQNVFKKEVDDVLGVPLSEATVLLRHYRWKKDKLFEDWCKDQDKVRKACGLRSKERKEIGDLAGDFDCPFCLNTQPLSKTLALACGHRFCEDCWTSWLTAEMEKGPQAVFTSCPQFKCGEMVPEDVFLKFVKGKQVELLTRWLMRNFIEGNDNLKWCPGEGCSRAVKYEAGGQKDIECVCGRRFCFNCADEAHQPCPCHLVALWAVKNKSDKENTEWINAFTKMCPKCKVHIEKNQGCNHMTCRNCKFEFCWLCKGDWKQHGSATGGFYSCNTYETQKQKGSLSSEELKSQEAQNSLNKYIFYFKRYTEYEKAIVFAQKTSQQSEERMHTLQAKKGVNIKSVDFLHQAIQTVIQCRRALKWSYVIGYYLKIGSSKQLFEDDQGHLEQLADKLHGMVERPLDELLSEKLREEIISLTNATKKYQQNLADGIMGGRYEDGLPT